VTNCSFSTRWSIFRFGGGQAENIAISNCLIYDTYGCPIKMRCGARSRMENISFSNLVMQNVTGPISIGLDSRRRSSTAASTPSTQPAQGVVRNISFNGIRATVVAEGRQHEDLPFPSAFRDGERRQCIVINGAGAEEIENISFNDVQVTYEGGGTAEEAAREVPKIAGEYFEIGTPPAYGMYARNVRGLTLHNVRFETTFADERPAIVFDHVSDAALNGLSATGHPKAPLLRLIETRQALLSASRLLSPSISFLRLEGALSGGITIDGGDFSSAQQDVELLNGAKQSSLKVRA
jgi:polygalacturonase